MMKMSGRVTSCCVALFFALTSVTAVRRLDSINDLKKIDFGQSVPKHSLMLLHWFANTVDIDNNNVIQLTFDPNRGDYGAHHYGNYERILDPLPLGNRYYTIGNLNQGTSMSLPPYVVHSPTEYMGTNRDRIIIRVREQNAGQQALPRIDRVYITQHYDTSERQGTRYDPAHTYQITTNLLRQIRELSVGQNQQLLRYLRNHYGGNAEHFLLRHIRDTWGDLAGLGLLLLIVIQEKHSSNQDNNRNGNRRNHRDDDSSESESNDSRDLRNQGMFVLNIPDHKDHQASRMTGSRESGGYNTSVHWNDKERSSCCTCCKCCICCIACICFICVICTVLYFWYKFK
ncbi:uncharacterized protein LOC125878909 [Epinephelus fuscoguttatus]|uniref:uncharacterized protein LOC125878909 n=1 Tax=Epinephelus fuscoguttatus TaxID=293821 RepID=UPI0020D0448E|nr:uncharacterized protein LOC125878909 [Epinephelus fuscoguttatus]